MIIIGLDPSLTGTGVTVVDTDAGTITTHTVTSKGAATATLPERRARLKRIVHEVDRHVLTLDDEGSPVAHLIVVESPSLGQARQGGTLDRNGLWWLLVDRLMTLGRPVASVAPAARAKYATGKGNASKDAVLLAVARRFPHVDVTNNNEADSLVLAAMGARHLGHPIDDMPVLHQGAMVKVEWPDEGAPF